MLNELIGKLFGTSGSKEVAKQRLKFALVYDQLEVSDDTLQNLQRDVVAVISRYFEIDKNSLKLDIQKEGRVSALVLNTPIKSVRRRRLPDTV